MEAVVASCHAQHRDSEAGWGDGQQRLAFFPIRRHVLYELGLVQKVVAQVLVLAYPTVAPRWAQQRLVLAESAEVARLGVPG